MAFAHSFPIDGTKPQDDDTISNEYPGPFDLTAAKAGSRMTGGMPEDDIAPQGAPGVRSGATAAQAPLTTPSPMTFMVNTCPNAFKPPLGGYRVGVAVRLHGASCSVGFGEGATP